MPLGSQDGSWEGWLRWPCMHQYSLGGGALVVAGRFLQAAQCASEAAAEQLPGGCAQEEKLLAEVEAVVEEERQKSAPDGAGSAHGVAHAANRLAQSLSNRGRDRDSGARVPLLSRCAALGCHI